MVDLTHRQVRKVAERLRDLGAHGEVRVLVDTARTAADAAAAVGCDVGAIVKSLVFIADDRPVLVLTSGAHRVDTSALKAELGLGHLERADADAVRAATGQSIGGVAPIAHPAPVPTYVDRALAGYPVVWAAAGHPHAVFSTTYDELLRIADGTPVTLA